MGSRVEWLARRYEVLANWYADLALCVDDDVQRAKCHERASAYRCAANIARAKMGGEHAS